MKTKTYDIMAMVIARLGFVFVAGGLIVLQFSQSHLIF